MHAAITLPGISRTFLTHMGVRGLEDKRYVVERFQAMADGDIRRVAGEEPAAKKGRRKPARSAPGRCRALRASRFASPRCSGARPSTPTRPPVSAVRARAARAQGECPIKEREAVFLGTGRGTGDPTMFDFDTDHDLVTPAGDGLIAELGLDVVPSATRWPTTRPRRCPDREAPADGR